MKILLSKFNKKIKIKLIKALVIKIFKINPLIILIKHKLRKI